MHTPQSVVHLSVGEDVGAKGLLLNLPAEKKAARQYMHAWVHVYVHTYIRIRPSVRICNVWVCVSICTTVPFQHLLDSVHIDEQVPSLRTSHKSKITFHMCTQAQTRSHRHTHVKCPCNGTALSISHGAYTFPATFSTPRQ